MNGITFKPAGDRLKEGQKYRFKKKGSTHIWGDMLRGKTRGLNFDEVNVGKKGGQRP